MQRPVAPVFRALHRYQRLHDAGGVVAHLGQVSDGGAALVDTYALGIGVVEIDSGHVRLPRLRFTLKNSRRKTGLIFGEIADGILRGIATTGGTALVNLSENYLSQREERDFRFGRFHEEAATSETLRRGLVEPWESDMMSEMQIHTIARQMMEKHGLTAIAQAAHNALACESKGDAEEAREWRHIEDAMKMMRGPHQS